MSMGLGELGCEKEEESAEDLARMVFVRMVRARPNLLRGGSFFRIGGRARVESLP